ncbi:MAG: addiction module protein [Pseudomonadota bacterium]
MTSIAEKLENELQNLSSEEKAALAHYLIEELDGEKDAGVEEIWRKEAKSRYQGFLDGKIETVSGKEAIKRARERLK